MALHKSLSDWGYFFLLTDAERLNILFSKRTVSALYASHFFLWWCLALVVFKNINLCLNSQIIINFQKLLG